MEARLFINAGTHVVGVVDGTAEMTKCENGDITAATLRYAPTMRVRRKTAPIEPSTFQTFSPTFQLRIAIPPSTMCQTTTRNSDFWHVLCLFSFFFFVMFLFSFVCLFFFLLVFFWASQFIFVTTRAQHGHLKIYLLLLRAWEDAASQ